jgi:hypothetical protein
VNERPENVNNQAEDPEDDENGRDDPQDGKHLSLRSEPIAGWRLDAPSFQL